MLSQNEFVPGSRLPHRYESDSSRFAVRSFRVTALFACGRGRIQGAA